MATADPTTILLLTAAILLMYAAMRRWMGVPVKVRTEPGQDAPNSVA